MIAFSPFFGGGQADVNSNLLVTSALRMLFREMHPTPAWGSAEANALVDAGDWENVSPTIMPTRQYRQYQARDFQRIGHSVCCLGFAFLGAVVGSLASGRSTREPG